MKRAQRAVAVAAAVLATAVVPPARAEDAPSFTTEDGRVLHVGDVVTPGERNGEVCEFAEPSVAIVTQHRSAPLSVTFTVDAACDVVVRAIRHSRVRPPVVGYRQPKWNAEHDSRAGATPEGGGVGGVGLPLPTVGSIGDAAPPATAEPMFAYLRQTIYDEVGWPVYEDISEAVYWVDWRTRRVYKPEFIDGECAVHGPPVPLVDRPFAEVRACYWKPIQWEKYSAGFQAGGLYRQRLRVNSLSVVVDDRPLTEWMMADADQTRHNCLFGPELPEEWSSECELSVA